MAFAVTAFLAGAEAAFFAVFLDFAQRALCAAAILARPFALMMPRVDFFANFTGLKLVALLGAPTAAGRPGFRFVVRPVPAKSAFTFCNCAISASIATTISFIF